MVAADERPGRLVAQPADPGARLERLPRLDGLQLASRVESSVSAGDDRPLVARFVGVETRMPSTGAAAWIRRRRSSRRPPPSTRPSPDGRRPRRVLRRSQRRCGRGGRVTRSAVEGADRVAGGKSRANGALWIVLVRRRSAVDGDHGVPDELLDRPSVPLERPPERLVVAPQQGTNVLGSTCSARAVEPTRSTNTAVTTLRSSRDGVSASALPQPLQYCASSGFSRPQCEQEITGRVYDGPGLRFQSDTRGSDRRTPPQGLILASPSGAHIMSRWSGSSTSTGLASRPRRGSR